MAVEILVGDCRDKLRALPDGSVHCCVSSPPYFGLRDYGVSGQMGLEATPEDFIAGMVDVFREVRRVLRDDGTLWLNIGDSYAGSGRGGYPGGASGLQGTTIGQDNSRVARGSQKAAGFHEPARQAGAVARPWVPPPAGLKQKDLIGIPWMLAFALRSDGWFLRQDIIWSKPNPMPESVRDRCTKSHEYLFLLSKSGRYFYDADAVAEGLAETSIARLSQNVADQAGSERVPGKSNGPMKAVARSGNTERKPGSARACPDGTGSNVCGSVPWEGSTRNKRSVWTVATQPFKEAHFATFPPALIEPCILAGTSPSCCSACGNPWRRIVERELVPTAKAAKTNVVDQRDLDADPGDQGANRQKDGHKPGWAYQVETLGFEPGCSCAAAKAHCVVLDPFGGAGTTGLVGDRLQRDVILIELNPEYAEIARRRLDHDRGGLLDAMEAA